MPPIVIDLLSSPELPAAQLPNRPQKSSHAAVASAGTKESAGTSKTLAYKSSELTNDGWLEISSDDLPSVARIKPSKPGATSESHVLPDDDLIPSRQMKEATLPKLGTAQKGDVGFTFLSDDFDSTINLTDDPFASSPAKKRNISPIHKLPSPKVPKTSLFQRSTSNAEPSFRTATTKAKRLSRSKTVSAVMESDPIVATSSPDPFADAAKRRRERAAQNTVSGLDLDSDNVFDLTQSPKSMGSNLSRAKDPKARNFLDPFDIETSSDLELPDIQSIVPAPRLSGDDSRTALQKYNAEKAAEEKKKKKKSKERTVSDKTKQANKEEKAIAKEEEKKRKALERLEKAAEKERQRELAKANTLRTDKKVSTPEMIVDLPSCMDIKLLSHTKAVLTPLNVEHTTWESSIPVVKWRRKVENTYNTVSDLWEPCPKHIRDEKHILYIMLAQEFVDLAAGEEGKDLDALALLLQTKFQGCKTIFLIEGLMAWERKNRGIKNKEFQQAVRNMAGEEEATQSQARKRTKKDPPKYVDEEMVEEALLRLQLIHKPLIHHTNAQLETAQWIMTFTQHISTIPYRQQKDSMDTTFSMESGQVKTGEDAADTFIKMLSEIRMLTPAVAHGIARRFPTVQQLVTGLQEGGPKALEDLRKVANKDGAVTDQRIGPALSKRVHAMLLGRDTDDII
ncbi:hypothetical protein BP6252_09704 [Coleophoma cylindrospora]|uniref:ERCC4 domain-containing protein n=1 Tax=Coleophoma cylindrospora TaxID=1849047 RepID=A0A3D8QWD2_9HELO|nr:hypothetical protein BP6252_09704 [Coleophoma cylindrospora]